MEQLKYIAEHAQAREKSLIPKEIVNTIYSFPGPNGTILLTAVGYLAFINDYESAVWLSEQFNLNKNFLAKGLGYSGSDNQLLRLIELEKDTSCSVSKSTAGGTLIYKNRPLDADEVILAKYRAEPYLIQDRHLIMEAANGGHQTLVIKLLNSSDDSLLNSATWGAARGGHWKLLEYLINTYRHLLPELLPNICFGLGENGNKDNLEKLLKIQSNLNELNVCNLLNGATMTGQVNLVIEIINQSHIRAWNQFIDTEIILRQFFEAGHIGAAYQLMKKINAFEKISLSSNTLKLLALYQEVPIR